MRGCEIARRIQHEDPVRRGPEHVLLAVRADVVDTGVGAGVGEEDEAVVEAEREAVGHWGSLASAPPGPGKIAV